MKYLTLLILLLFVQGCSPGIININEEMNQTGGVSGSLATNQTKSDLCDWYVQTQILRTERISETSSIDEWLSKYGIVGLDFNNDSAMQELLPILQEGLPSQHQFIKEWEVLGPTEGGEAFFENEKKSIELRIQGFELMISGINEQNSTDFYEGMNLFIQSGEYYTISESELTKVWNDSKEYFE